MTGQMMNTGAPATPDPVLWGLVLALHILGNVIWTGGAAYALLVLKPSLGLLDNTQRNSIVLQTCKRYFFLVWHAMPVVLITGWLMYAIPLGGFGNPDWHIQAMQGIGLIMALVFVYGFFGPYRRARRALRPQPAMFDKVRQAITANLLLGIVVVVIASLDHFQ